MVIRRSRSCAFINPISFNLDPGGFWSLPLDKKLNNFKSIQAMTTKLIEFPKIYLGTSWSRRDVYFNIDITMATELWQLVFTFVMKMMRIKNIIRINGFARSRALALEEIQKWPIHLSLVNFLLVLPQSSRTDLRCHGGLFSFDLDYRINRDFVFHSIFCVLLLSWMK